MRPFTLALLAALAACTARPSGLLVAGDGGAGGGGSSGHGGSGGLAPGGSGGLAPGGSGGLAPGGSGGEGSCLPGEMPLVYLEVLGVDEGPGRFPGQVVDSRRVDPSEVPDFAPGADHLLDIVEVRALDARYRLWYRVPHESLAAPVQPGDPVQLTFEEYMPWGRSAAAVLRDDRGRLLWVLTYGGFGDVELARGVLQVDPEGPPLCAADDCGFRQHAARVSLGDAGLGSVTPGSVVPLADGIFWLGELGVSDGFVCTDVPSRVVGYAWAAATVCGGFRGATCGGDLFCSYPPFDCGAADGTGVCRPRPEACPLLDEPVCGCDGERYASACLAAASGTSVGFGPCDGLFRCGDRFCRSGAEYCQRAVSDVGGEPDVWSCGPMPDCEAPAGCDCVASEPCASLCSEDRHGNVTLTCPGG